MAQFICGKNSVIDALKNNLPIKKLFLDRQHFFDFKISTEVIIISRKQMDKMTKENHQGFIAELKEFNYYGSEIILRDKPQKILILDHIQDPHNLGAILRTANAAGLTHIVIPKERAVKVTPTVLKVASGGIVNLKIIRVGSLVDLVQNLKKNNYWVYATAFDKEAVEINKASFNENTIIIVGSESKGVSRSLLKISDQKIYIPMKGTVQSLNVSVATGIILFKI